jgi:hypothetical protein
VAHASRRQWKLGATLVAIYQGAAAADREAAAELGEALRGRKATLDRVVEGMGAVLRPELDVGLARSCRRCAGRRSIESWWMSRGGPPTSTKPGWHGCSNSNCCLEGGKVTLQSTGPDAFDEARCVG